MMLGVVPELWATMLAAMKLGLVLIPAMPTLGQADIADRLERGQAKYLVAHGADAEKFAGLVEGVARVAVGATPSGWLSYDALLGGGELFAPDGPTKADDPMLLYFTSGTTARSKLVVHTHASYPIGHLSTMYGLGLRPGDAHLNISSPGWAKHAWSSFFAPWNAGAAMLALSQRFEPRAALDALVEHQVTVFCAPPTVWRMLIQHDLRQWKVVLREVNAAGEPVNPEIIEQVRRAWGLALRDSYGQTETTMMIGNSPGQRVVPGSMGRPLPGYRVALIDADGLESDTGEIALPLRPRPVGLMSGYQNEHGQLMPIEGEYYKTGDVAARDADGYITFIGRADDVFKSSDYRLSPFELESVLIEHPAIAEAAVVPAPDPVRYTIAKGYVALAQGHAPTARRRRRSSSTCAGASRPTSLCAGSNSMSCPRPYRARSGASSFVSGKARSPSAANARRRNSGSRIFRRGEAETKRPRQGGGGAGKPRKGRPWPHIAVSEPWPFGVFMPSQVPLATYFQWAGS